MTPDEIKKLRHRLGLSQEAFARRLDVALATVSRWESGHRVPKGLYARELLRLRDEVEGADTGTARK